MTREEKIKGLYSLKEYLVENPIELEGHKSLPITLIDYAIKALEQEPITKNCESCRYYDSHHKVCNYCYNFSLWTEVEPTTKNDLGVDAISRQQAIERLKLNFPISDGADNSRDRHRYMQAMADIQAIRELPSVTPQEPQTFKWCTEKEQ